MLNWKLSYTKLFLGLNGKDLVASNLFSFNLVDWCRVHSIHSQRNDFVVVCAVKTQGSSLFVIHIRMLDNRDNNNWNVGL